MNSTEDKIIVREYFNATGFERWRRIYGDGEVNQVQLDIRYGHQQTVDTVLGWLKADGPLQDLTICDAGCGVGSLSIPLAQAGARVFGSDISAKMIQEAQARAGQDLPNLSLEVQDLEHLGGTYHTVVCLDVLIHYPDPQVQGMISHLSSLATDRLVLSFAPKNLFYTALKKIGEFFPGPSKATRAYLHAEGRVRQILTGLGWTVGRTDLTTTRFYFSRILEATRTDG